MTVTDMKTLTVFLILLAASPAFCGQVCPGDCECFWSPNGLRMDCSKKDLKMVPILKDDGNGSKTQSVRIGQFSNNNLSLDDQLAIYGYENVTELDFRNCIIQEILGHIFKGLLYLEKLDLSSNQIANIQPGSFDDLSSLTELDLSRNRLATLNQDTLIGLTNLVTLDLSENKLQVLSIPSLFKKDRQHEQFKYMTKLSIGGNPWKCNCELGPLHRDMKARGLLTEDVMCSKLSGGGRWTEMTPDNFTCPPSLTLFSPPQKVALRDNLTVQCQFEGNPKPKVFWRRAGGEVIQAGGNLNISSVEVSSDRGQYLGVVRSRLSIFDLQAPDVGNVECCAVNIVGKATKLVRVSLSSALQASNLGTVVRI